MTESIGQQARRLIAEARVILADPSKAQYHKRLQQLVDAMEAELAWWVAVGAAMRQVDAEQADR